MLNGYNLKRLAMAGWVGLMTWAAAQAQDQYEPDNTIGQASNILANIPQSHLFTNELDIDCVRFTTTVDHAYQIGMTNLDAESVLGSLSLYGPATNWIETVDNMTWPFMGGDIWSTSFLGTAGVYYAQAAADNSGPGSDIGPYWMVLADLGSGDQYEPDNTLATASNLVVGAAHTNHTLHWSGDQDFMQFTNVALHLFYVTFTNYNISGDLRVYDSQGILRADDIAGLGYNDGEAYAFLPYAGTNYCSVTTAGVSSPTSTYDLLVIDLEVPAGADPYEVDDAPALASNIVAGTSQTNRSIHHAADFDYLAFTNAAQHYYRIDVTNLTATLDAVLVLYDASGTNQLAYSQVIGDESISWFFLVGGTNYILVRNYANTMSDTGTYHVALTDLGYYPPDPYEADNSAATASNIVMNVPQTTRTIHWGEDLDYLKFTAQAYHAYRVSVTNVGMSLDARLVLYAQDGSTVLASADTGTSGADETLSHAFFSTGTNYLLVGNTSLLMTDTGAYHIVVTDLGAVTADSYEPDNAVATASNLVVDVAQTNRTLHLTNDLDYVKVALQSNRYYRFETFNRQLSLIADLQLLGTNGTDVLTQQTNSLDYRITVAGDYYLRVAVYSNLTVGAYALRVSDLRIRYKWTAGGGGWGTPAVGPDGTIYHGRDKVFYALQPDGAGTQRWNNAASNDYSVFYSAPVVGTNGIIFMAAQDGLNIFNTNGTTNGWAELTSLALPIEYPALALGPSNSVYLGAGTNRFYALNSQAHTNWMLAVTGRVYEPPAVDADGNVYFSSTDQNLRKLSSTGAVVWSVNLGQPLYAGPAIDANGNIIAAGSTGTVFLVSATNGAVLRTWQAGTNFGVRNSPVIGPTGTVYIGNTAGRLYALQPDGAVGPVWTLSAEIVGTPAVGQDGTIYVGAFDGQVFALHPNGTTNFVWNMGAEIYACAPTIGADGMVYQNCQNGLYALYGVTWPTNGLALSAWPMLSHDARHTGQAGPPAPPGVTASDGSFTDRVAVAWMTVTNAMAYEVWRGVTNTPLNTVLLSQPVTTNYADTNAVPGQTYYYWVRSRSAVGEGALSAYDIGWRALRPPTGVSASDGTYTYKVFVSWGACSGTVNYAVWRNVSNDAVTATNIGTTASTAYADTAATPGIDYYYWVAAVGASGFTSAWSAANTGWRALTVPTGMTASDGTCTDRVVVSWTAVAGAQSYAVWRSATTNISAVSNLDIAMTTTYADLTIPADVTNYYRVTACGANGSNSAFSLPDAGWRTSSNPPVPPEPTNTISPPASVSASAGIYRDKVRVSWAAVTNATAYEVWRNTANNSNAASRLADVTATFSGRKSTDSGSWYNDTSALRGILYYYWLKAKNAAVTSDFSVVASGWRPSAAGGLAGDYDGDGKADPVLYDEQAGTWYILLSGAGYARLALSGFLGGPGYMPVAADYDGDRKTDPAVYGTTNGDWVVLLTSMNYERLELPALLGGVGFSPAPGDFDGDHLADPGVYGEAAGDWLVMLSTAGYVESRLTAFLGGMGYGPVPADYDGDGKADPALYHESDGNWVIMMSASGYQAALLLPAFLGGPGWLPMPADYDGDGLADPAVRSETTNEWRILMSASGYTLVTVILGL